MDWIPCKERLPEVFKGVILFDAIDGVSGEGYRRGDGNWYMWRWNAVVSNDRVMAWMPMPNPYIEQ